MLRANGVSGGDQVLSNPDTIRLSIPRNYLVFVDSQVVVSQFITDSLPAALGMILSFNEVILYDPSVLELVGVSNGANTPAPDWTITEGSTIPGILPISASTSGGALKGPGEILKLHFYVVSTDTTFSSTTFVDSLPEFSGVPANTVISSSSGFLRVINSCVPLLGADIIPTSSVMSCAPNPAAQSAGISYFVSSANAASGQAQFRLYNAAGSLVRTIGNADASMGWHHLEMNVSDLCNGAYSLEFLSGANHQIQRVFVLH